MRKTSIAMVLACLLLATLAYGQWEPDQRLTDDPSESQTGYAQSIAVVGDTLHVVWYDKRDGNYEIYYKRSTDGGTTWGNDARLTDDAAFSSNGSVVAAGDNVHIVWHDERDGNAEIYYKRSTDGGTTWSRDRRLTVADGISFVPSIALAGDTVHVVWSDFRDYVGQNPLIYDEIYYKRSTDGGTTWGTDIRLTDIDHQFSHFPSIAVAGDTLHLAWDDQRDANPVGNDEIYYKRSTDGGETWSSDTRLTNDEAWSCTPTIVVAGNNLHVVWPDNRDGHYAVYYKRSTDGGKAWSGDIEFTESTYPTQNPKIAATGDNVHAVWRENRGANQEIYYKRSADNGATWDDNLRLTNAPDISWFPSLAVAGEAVHVVWLDKRDGNYEVYYKRNPTGNVAVVEPGLRHLCGVLRIAPNPLASGFATLRFSLAKAGPVALTVFDVAGRSVLRQSAICSLQSAIALDLRKVPAGVYLVRLDADGYTATQTLVVQSKSGRN